MCGIAIKWLAVFDRNRLPPQSSSNCRSLLSALCSHSPLYVDLSFLSRSKSSQPQFLSRLWSILRHHICNNCGSKVDVDAESCSECHTSSGTYWLAIVEPLAPPGDSQLETAVVADADPNDVDIDGDLWDEIQPAIAVLPIDTAVELPERNAQRSIEREDILEIDPWEPSQPLSSVPVSSKVNEADLESSLEPLHSVATLEREELIADRFGKPICHSQTLAPTTYLDPECRYRLLDPVVIQLLTPTDSSQVRAIDRQPFCKTLLETLMEQQPVTAGSNSYHDEMKSDKLSVDTLDPEALRSSEPYRHWQFWHSHGIPKVAQAYIALQVSMPGTIPTIHDSWNDTEKTVTVVEDRSNWPLLVDSWQESDVQSSQLVYWMDYTLKLWMALEPWQMRQSLLEIGNLRLDEDNRVCLQRLYPEPIFVGAPPKQYPLLQLADLAKMWQGLFERRELSPSPSLLELMQSIEHGELTRPEDVRSGLRQIAYELEPKQLSSPLHSAASAELTNGADSRTLALAQSLLQLEEAAATHTGKKRDHNEDCYGMVSKTERRDHPKGSTFTARGLYILCDGMGGHAGGEIASAMTVDILRDYFTTHWGDTLPDENTIREGIIAANEAVHDVNQKNSAQGSGRMGTTLVLVLVQGRDIAVAHVGDSRCYGITPTQGLIQLTLDHEVGQQQILRGVDPEIAYGRPDSYQLTQAIGPRDRNYIAPDIRFFELQEDTLILLASDGLTDNQLLENYWLTNLAPLLSASANLQNGVERLIDFANEYNGHDNITAIVVRARLG